MPFGHVAAGRTVKWTRPSAVQHSGHPSLGGLEQLLSLQPGVELLGRLTMSILFAVLRSRCWSRCRTLTAAFAQERTETSDPSKQMDANC